MAAAAEALDAAYGQPVAVSAVLEPVAVAAAAATAAPKSGWDRVAPVLGAIGTGVGVIGFVTFIGGVTVYARLRAAGFPAAPALGIFPSQDLVVIGAQTLVPEVLWACSVRWLRYAFGAAAVVTPMGSSSRGALHVALKGQRMSEAVLLGPSRTRGALSHGH